MYSNFYAIKKENTSIYNPIPGKTEYGGEPWVILPKKTL